MPIEREQFPQLIKIAARRGLVLSFPKCPYQVNVMAILEAISNKIGRYMLLLCRKEGK
jgi:hypothetical protein